MGSARLRKACRCGAPARVTVVELESGIDGIGVGQVFGTGGGRRPAQRFLGSAPGTARGYQPTRGFLADTGCFSEKNVETCHAAAIDPLIAARRAEHHRHWRERFEEPAPLAAPTAPSNR